MRDEFVGEHGRVGADVDEVDGEGGDLGQNGAAQGVGQGEGGRGQDEVAGVGLGL